MRLSATVIPHEFLTAVIDSVIVCAFSEERFFPACLDSLLAQSRPADDIIVVNNASTDRTRAVASVDGVARAIGEDGARHQGP